MGTGGLRPIGDMNEWMRDKDRRISLLERRLRPTATSTTTAPTLMTLAVGTVLRDNGDGTLTVVEATPLIEPEDL